MYWRISLLFTLIVLAINVGIWSGPAVEQVDAADLLLMGLGDHSQYHDNKRCSVEGTCDEMEAAFKCAADPSCDGDPCVAACESQEVSMWCGTVANYVCIDTEGVYGCGDGVTGTCAQTCKCVVAGAGGPMPCMMTITTCLDAQKP